MYTAIQLSKYIVSKCIEDGHPISNLKLQKILYYIQKDFLNCDSIAFSDDIEAWQIGPVVPNVYYYYCGYGTMPILSVYETYSIESKDALKIDKILEDKRDLEPWTMIAEIHKINGAWNQIYNKGLGNKKVIPTKLIKAVG